MWDASQNEAKSHEVFQAALNHTSSTNNLKDMDASTYQAFEFSFSHKDRAKSIINTSDMPAPNQELKGNSQILKLMVTPRGRKDKFMETSIISSGQVS